MANVLVQESSLIDIANAIREKTSTENKYLPSEMGNAIRAIEGSYSDLGNKMYELGAISDPHVSYGDGATKLKNAILFLQNEGAEFICSSGDIGMSNLESELQTYKDIIDEVATVPVYSCTGNHDRGHTNENWNAYVGHDLNFVFEKENDVFIFFSLKTATNTTSTEAEPYGEENLLWLQEQFDLYKGRRIFLFTHNPLSGYSGLRTGTYYGFSNASTEDDTILGMMNSNKSVLHFSGHTHFAYEVEETYDNINVIPLNFSDCATIHIPSSNYPRDAANTAIYTGMSQGCMVTVYENGVVLKAVDFMTASYIEGYEYVLPIKNSATETNNVLIVSDASVTVEEGATVTFTARLSHPIGEDVTVNLSVDNSCVTVDKTTLVFTADNYNVEQTVTVTSVDDEETVDVFSVITLSADGVATKKVSVTVTNTDEAVTLVPYTWENASVGTNGEPADYVTAFFRTTVFSVTAGDELDIYVDSGLGGGSSAYVFFYSSENVGSDTFIGRIELITGINAVAVPDNAVSAIVRSTKDPSANINTIGNYIYVCTVDEGLSVSTDAISINEGATGTFTVKMLREIKVETTVLLSADNAYVTFDKESLTFTPDNYNVEQTVTVTAAHKNPGIPYSKVYVSCEGITPAIVTVTCVNTDETVVYTWEEGYIDSSGNLSDDEITTYYRTTPIPVVAGETFKVHVEATLTGSSSVYLFFYSSDTDISSTTHVGSRITLSKGTTNENIVPDTAVAAIIRSTANPSATANNIGNYIYVAQ